MVEESYATLSEVLERIRQLESERAQLNQRIGQQEAELQSMKPLVRRLRLAKATLLRLQDGDVLVLRIQRPLATSEQEAVVNQFKALFRKLGKNVDLAVICGHDEVNLEVIRANAT